MNRYITRIELENFQGHKKSSVDFSSGVNSFVGASDAGKSACVKAIEWVHSNKICGERPTTKLHHDSIKSTTKGGNMKLTGETIVRIFFSDGHIIEKIKGKDQLHNITYPDGKGIQLTATGQTVPDEVIEIFTFTDINHATQAESFFILFDSPLSIAKKLNEITDLTLGDKLLTLIKSETRALNSKKTLLEEDIARITKDVEQYKDLPIMEEELNELEDLEEQIHILKKNTKDMDELITSYNKYETELQEYLNITEHKDACNELIEIAKEVKSAKDKYIEQDSYLKDIIFLLEQKALLDKLSIQKEEIDNLILDKKAIDSLYSNIDEMQRAIDEIAKYQHRLDVDFKPEEYNKDLDELLQLCKETDKLRGIHAESKSLLEEFLMYFNKKKSLVEELDILKKELGDALKDECPLCGRRS